MAGAERRRRDVPPLGVWEQRGVAAAKEVVVTREPVDEKPWPIDIDLNPALTPGEE